MARGVNKVILVGNLGDNPIIRYTATGDAVTSISIATSESWKDKTTGEVKEKTEWHNITFFRKLAEIAGEYLKKGSQVYIEGSLRTRKYTDKNGIERYATEVVASELQMLGGRQAQGFVQDDAAHPVHSFGDAANAASPTNQPEISDADTDDLPF